jgi:hypothetical protein
VRTEQASEKTTNVRDVVYITTHPLGALKARIRQITVAIEHELPPHGTTIEEFPELSLSDATRAILGERKP